MYPFASTKAFFVKKGYLENYLFWCIFFGQNICAAFYIFLPFRPTRVNWKLGNIARVAQIHEYCNVSPPRRCFPNHLFAGKNKRLACPSTHEKPTAGRAERQKTEKSWEGVTRRRRTRRWKRRRRRRKRRRRRIRRRGRRYTGELVCLRCPPLSTALFHTRLLPLETSPYVPVSLSLLFPFPSCSTQSFNFQQELIPRWIWICWHHHHHHHLLSASAAPELTNWRWHSITRESSCRLVISQSEMPNSPPTSLFQSHHHHHHTFIIR